MPTRSLCYLFVHPCIHPSPGLPQEHGLNVALGARKQRFESRGLLFCILGAHWHTGASLCGDIQNEGFERENKYLSVSRWKKITSNGGNTGVCGRKIGEWGQIIRLLFLDPEVPLFLSGWLFLAPQDELHPLAQPQGKELFKSPMNLNKRWKWLSPFILINIMSTFLG